MLVLVNLEQTFRSAVGTMRWRIKFMILGVGFLFAARAYTASQMLLFSQTDFSLQVVGCEKVICGVELFPSLQSPPQSITG